MRDELEVFAKELFKKTAEDLGTDKFYIAGGVLRGYVENKYDTPNDIDCFFGYESEYLKAVGSLLSKGFWVIKERSNSVQVQKGNIKYDLVCLPNITDGSSVIDDFDFTNSCAVYGNEGLVTCNDFFKDVKNRELKINKLKIPYHSIHRAGKFMKLGYKMSDKDKIDLFNNAALSPHGPYSEDEYVEAITPFIDIKS